MGLSDVTSSEVGLAVVKAAEEETGMGLKRAEVVAAVVKTGAARQLRTGGVGV